MKILGRGTDLFADAAKRPSSSAVVTQAVGRLPDRRWVCRHDFEFLGWTSSGGQMRRCRSCECKFTDWAGTRYWDSSIPMPSADEPVARCLRGTELSAKTRKDIAAVDAMPKALRACVHEFGFTVVRACLEAGVKDPRIIRHLVREIWDGARQSSGQSKTGPLNGLDWLLTQLSTGLDSARLARFLWLKGFAIVPREPSAQMVEASMRALDEEGLVTKPIKHRLRLRAAIIHAVAHHWPTLIAADADAKARRVA